MSERVKSRAFRLCAEREAGFTKCLRELLQDHSCWSQMATKMLEVPLEPPDSKNITLVLGNVEVRLHLLSRLLFHSRSTLEEKTRLAKEAIMDHLCRQKW